jgi:predicted XRE-type DNA-binding protein
MITLKKHLAGTGLSEAQIAKLFGVTQPRVSDLMRGRIDEFGLDALVNMAVAAGLRVKLSVRKTVGFSCSCLLERRAGKASAGSELPE